MRSVEEHLDRVLGLAGRLEAESCPIGEGDGRTLAEDLPARMPVPPFDNSAMDGFAVRAADLATGVVLQVGGTVPPGHVTCRWLGRGRLLAS